MGQWSRGYDVALTTRRSPVQFRPGPLLPLGKFPCETKVKYPFLDLSVFSFHDSR